MASAPDATGLTSLTSLTSLTRNTTTAFLAGVGLVQTIAAMQADDAGGEASSSSSSSSSSKRKANAIGAAVCLVAFLHYSWMRTAPSAESRIELRYGDWLVTCPLLLWELHEMTGVRGGQTWAIGAVIGMILLGYAAVRPATPLRMRYTLFAASCVLLAGVAYATVRGARRHAELVAAFFALWAAYPIAFLLKPQSGNTMYNLLDLASKGLFGLYVATL